MDIVSLPIEFDEKKIDGRYRLVNAATKRAREIMQGICPGKTAKGSKAAIMALEDVLSEDVEILIGEEALKVQEDVKKHRYEQMLEDAKGSEDSSAEELTELEKDLKVYLEKGGKESRVSIEKIFDRKKEG